MNVDKITKLLLGVIAINLSVMTIKEISVVPQAFAGDSKGAVGFNSTPEYGLVPLNEDGSISVSLSNTDKIDVRIVDEVKVNISRFSVHQALEINLGRIGGSSIYGSLPVQLKD